MHVTANNEA